MARMGRLFRRNFGNTRLSHEERVMIGEKMAKADKGINVKSIRDRKSYDFYGKTYSDLNQQQKQHINKKAYALIEQGARD